MLQSGCQVHRVNSDIERPTLKISSRRSQSQGPLQKRGPFFCQQRNEGSNLLRKRAVEADLAPEPGVELGQEQSCYYGSDGPYTRNSLRQGATLHLPLSSTNPRSWSCSLDETPTPRGGGCSRCRHEILNDGGVVRVSSRRSLSTLACELGFPFCRQFKNGVRHVAGKLPAEGGHKVVVGELQTSPQDGRL